MADKIRNFQNIKYGDTFNTEDARVRTGSIRRETNLNSDDDMLGINHQTSHYSDNMLSDCVRVDDTSSHSKLLVILCTMISRTYCCISNDPM